MQARSLLSRAPLGIVFIALVATVSARAEAFDPLKDPQLSSCGLVLSLDTQKKNMDKALSVYEKDPHGKGFRRLGAFHSGFGQGSDRDYDGKLDQLSNAADSKETPAGNFEVESIGPTQNASHLGDTLRLRGLSKTNSNSDARGILVHLGFMHNKYIDAVKKKFKQGTVEFVQAMQKVMSNPATSLSTYTHGCISIATDVLGPGGKSEWQFVLDKAREHFKRKERVCVHVPNVVGGKVDEKLMALLAQAKKKPGEMKSFCSADARPTKTSRH